MSQAIAADAFVLTDGLAGELADRWGTPLYVVDKATFCRRIGAYRSAFAAVAPQFELNYASKANSTLALIAIAHREGCGIDVASEGELRAAIRAGVPASHCHLHGNNKSQSDLEFAISVGIGKIVADSFEEIAMLAELRPPCDIVVRLAPGVDPKTHAKISTGQADTKFGFNIADGSALRAVEALRQADLNLMGFHCHVGSQLMDGEAQVAGGETIAQFALDAYRSTGFRARYLNFGGGLGISYDAQENPQAIADYVAQVVGGIRAVLAGTPLDQPDLMLAQEPGRSLIGPAGVTLYRVGVVKETPVRTFVSVDGGLADNPRPALYGARYEVRLVGAESQESLQIVTVSGRHCETDTLFPDVSLPKRIRKGDLIQVLATGAYGSSMANNYNRYPRPATVLIRPDGPPAVLQRRETYDEMFARELMPRDLVAGDLA